MSVVDRQAFVDLSAITGNVAALCELVRGSQVMAAVKADGYGHGMVPAARAALAGGAGWLGVAGPLAIPRRRSGTTSTSPPARSRSSRRSRPRRTGPVSGPGCTLRPTPG